MNAPRWLTRRRAAFGAAGAAAAVVLASAMGADPPEVDVAEVATGALEVTVAAEGVTRVLDAYTVTAPITGRLERLTLRAGDPVTEGEVLAVLHALPLDAQGAAQARAHAAAAAAMVTEAETRLAQAGESLRQAERTVARMHAVAGAGAASTEAVEQAELQQELARRERDAAASRATAARAEIAAARALLMGLDASDRSATVIRAPASGRILQLQDASERVVGAGTPLLQLGDPGTLEVAIEVLSTEAVRVEEGAAVRLVEWGRPDTVMATVRRVEPSAFTRISALGVEEQRVLVIAALADAPAGLGSGYQVQARIVTWSAPSVLRVPNSALFRRGDSWHAFVAEGGRAYLREVQTGQRGSSHTEVIGGLRAGEQVVLFPSDLVSDGGRIRPTVR
jgi:HlyD family secretion protein